MTRATEPAIRTTEAAHGDVLIQLSYPTSNIDGRRADLTITDQVSGIMLVKVSLNPEQLMDFMSHTGTRVSGARLPKNPERIGRRLQTGSTSLGRQSDRTPEEVRDAYLADGWDSVRIDNTNYGHRVVAHRWIEDKPAEEA